MLNWIVLNGTDYLIKMDLALNNLQRLICHKTKPNQTKPNQYIFFPFKPLLIIFSLKILNVFINKIFKEFQES